MYQTTLKVSGFVTVTTEKPLSIKDREDLTIKLDVFDDEFTEDTGKTIEVNETDVTDVRIMTEVAC